MVFGMRRRELIAAALLVGAGLAARPASAQAAPLRIARPLDLVALPLVVMQHEHLIERVAESMGLGEVKIAWSAPAGDPLDALAKGETDLAAAEVAPFLIAADGDTPPQVRAIGALAQRPYVLVSRNRTIRTIRDFGPKDHIAVPALKTSGPALMLEMAAAQEWGPEHYDQLDRFVVAQPDAAATDALLSGKGSIDAHFSRTPYADDELGDPKIHRVMDSFDIAGPHSVTVLATTMRLHERSPELCKAILAALQSADDLIAKTPGAAAEMFAATVKDQDIPLEDLSDMIGDPDLAYRAASAGIMRLAEFMHQVGRLKRQPASWQDLFLPEARDLKGD
ncbi:MAG TPA: hypothetical protein VJR70_05380 [Stellaceae bacterium]|nr:hypothetical protein [Stellaceae bacterium]